MLKRKIVQLTIAPFTESAFKTDKVAQNRFKNNTSSQDEIDPSQHWKEIYLQVFRCPKRSRQLG
ncbi:MAG TPA: hypothetical protein VIY47_02925, partial [Ignavibacteriaceae bacterium]